ncbi:thioredoxin-dependent thiol peroxidase [Hyphomicrobiales bacterium]|jgi:peroxiredoxin Q/BCP|nr:thioredoxin-dependent thiol peroxidase [Hyphomicrobiales bacterium]MDA9904946.1 thioredoxin-dependent thiol peroxidase [Hyphomicrobiales bacterium]
MTNELKIDDTIPTFVLPLSDDTLLNSKELKKKLYIIYFYPKDNTPGCTNEAKDFSSFVEKFKKLDVDVIGVSKDSIKKHLNFIEKQSLKIKLASDETGEVIESFGVWVEKKMYGRSYMGIERSTFIVSRNGKILEVYRKVKVKNHAQLVLERVQEILTSN